MKTADFQRADENNLKSLEECIYKFMTHIKHPAEI